jgi:pimeloyl-ACP methyl ester carboxylesterase
MPSWTVPAFSIAKPALKDASTVLLLHGFPTSSHMFRNLIPLLADHFHVVAPDLPGFGYSYAPDREHFRYTFENLAKVADRFTQTLALERYAIYVFDCGAPVGLRLESLSQDLYCE